MVMCLQVLDMLYMRVIKSIEHKTLEHDWLRTTHHFSFGEYRNPDRMGFGPLRVFNDDVIQPGKGFDFHQHRDMEIVTYVICGELEHKDNFGNSGIIRAGEIQTMSAGTGVFHSEYNHSDAEPLRLLQMWVFPRYRDLRPSWAQQSFTEVQRQDRLLGVISPAQGMTINQDVSFYVSRLDPDKTVKHQIGDGRQAYLYVIDGKIGIGDCTLDAGDSAEITRGGEVLVTARSSSEIILLDLPVEYQKNLERAG